MEHDPTSSALTPEAVEPDEHPIDQLPTDEPAGPDLGDKKEIPTGEDRVAEWIPDADAIDEDDAS